jgi:protein-L-isoaspartate(D-aspartate) O-methyltransferase
MANMFSDARKNMVDGQVHTAGVSNPLILEAFGTVPRELFVPEKLKNVAYTDISLDLGQGRSLLAPIAYSKMLEFAAPQPHEVVLDVAAASGYSSVILSKLVNTVISLDKNKRQKDKAQRAMQSLDICNVVQVDGDVAQGASEYAPYSLIVINGAVEEVPQVILDQLAVNGRLITIVQTSEFSVGKATIFTKSDKGVVSSKILFDAAVPSIPEFEKAEAFSF